jgi:hypothetical protein
VAHKSGQKTVKTTPRKVPKVTKVVRCVDGTDNPVKHQGMTKSSK